MGDAIRLQQTILILLKELLEGNQYEGLVIIFVNFDGQQLNVNIRCKQNEKFRSNQSKS